MPELHAGWDPEEPGSRFTSRPALLLVVSESDRLALPADARTVVRQQVGTWILDEQPEIGAPEILDGSTGRGAEGWGPVLEWFFNHAAGGVIGGVAMAVSQAVARATWQRTRAAATILAVLLRRTRHEAGARVLVSRGLAALVAVNTVAGRLGDNDLLVIEAVEEPSALREERSPELGYVGIEPWIVLLRSSAARYVVIVGFDGEVLGTVTAPVSDAEHYYYPLFSEE